MKLQLSFIIFVVLFCFSFENHLRIIGGDDAEEMEFPFMVSIQYDNQHYCGGTILNRLQILTAAHCVSQIDIEKLSVHFTNTLNFSNPEAIAIPVAEAIYDNYDILQLIYDVAIINLNSTIPDKFYYPVQLADEFDTKFKFHNGILLGWGDTKNENDNDNLKKVNVLVYTDEICSQSHYGIRNIEHHVCAGWPINGKGSCTGDSGGPLLVDDVQVGIISLGQLDCTVSNGFFPKVLARVTRYLDWIRNNTILEEVVTTTSDGFQNSTVTEEITTNYCYRKSFSSFWFLIILLTTMF